MEEKEFNEIVRRLYVEGDALCHCRLIASRYNELTLTFYDGPFSGYFIEVKDFDLIEN